MTRWKTIANLAGALAVGTASVILFAIIAGWFSPAELFTITEGGLSPID